MSYLIKENEGERLKMNFKKRGIISILISITLLSTIFLSVQTTNAENPNESDFYPNAKIPSEQVTMNVSMGIDSYFTINLTNVPSGYHVKDNTDYYGWCFQQSVPMTQKMEHQVKLYHSYDPTRPNQFKTANWDMINYVINNKNGFNKTVIQNVIWSLIEGTEPLNLGESELYLSAMENGDGYCPGIGDRIAVLITLDEVKPEKVQNTFIEVPLNYSGCNPSFWRENIDQWPSGFSPDDKISTYFDVPIYSFQDTNLSQILWGTGWEYSGPYSPLQIFFCSLILKEATAGLLNSQASCVNYPLTYEQIIVSVNDGLYSWDSFLLVWLMIYNNLDCKCISDLSCSTC